jgi:hypothetical protein
MQKAKAKAIVDSARERTIKNIKRLRELSLNVLNYLIPLMVQ